MFPPGSCFDRPRIAEKVGEPVEPSTHPHCGDLALPAMPGLLGKNEKRCFFSQ